MCGFEISHGRRRNILEEILSAADDRVVASRIVRDAKSLLFIRVSRDVCDPTEAPITESGGEYNESYANSRFWVARGETVCYINQVSERHCRRLYAARIK